MMTVAATKESYLVYEHDGLALPGDTVDLGQLDVKFTTQSLVVGFHHEVDQVRGYASSVGFQQDQRPSATARGNVSVTLMTLDEQTGNPTQWKYPEGYEGDSDTNKSPGAADGGLVTFKNLPTDMHFTVRAEVADTGRSRQLVSDSELETYIVDGRLADVLNKGNRGAHSVGAFGPQGGTRPEVRLCPLATGATRPDCSTFAYALADGMVSGTTQSAGGSNTAGVVVKLTPVLSLGEVEEQVDTVKATETGYEFTNIVAGVYTVSVAATDDWAPPSTGAEERIQLMSNDGSDRDADTGLTAEENFVLTYQKTSILGVVGNDESDNNAISPSETATGIEVKLRGPTRTGRPGATLRTTKTDRAGKYSFEDLPEGTYFVEGVATDEYEIWASSEGTTPKFVLTSAAIATTFENKEVSGRAVAPRFNPHLGTIGDDGMPTNLTYFPLRGTISVTAFAPDDTNLDAQGNGDADSDLDPYEGVPFYLERCLTSTAARWGDGLTCEAAGTPGSPVATGGGTIDANFPAVRMVTGEDGVATFSNLRLGVYRAVPNLAGLTITIAPASTPIYWVGMQATDWSQTFNVTVP